MTMIKKIIYISLNLLFIASCADKQPQEEKTIAPKSPVKISSISIGSINDNLILSATTIYLKRNVITSEIPAFITKVNIHLGDKINKGQVLYELQTKESKALGKNMFASDSALSNLGIIKIYAPATGVISTFDKQQTGDYVLEGTQLCTIAESSNLAFQINVPYEYNQYTKVGNQCAITLPDNRIHYATINTPLTVMNVLAQTQTMLAKCNEELFLPENLVVKVQVLKTLKGSSQILSKPCVLSDEMMKEFWVMKLINDTTAVKVPVTIGNKNDHEIEIVTPVFNKSDRIIIDGNYGLKDTAFVKINQ